MGGVTFFDCTNPPRTRDYPDCRTIVVSTESPTCPPANATINITSYPGIARTIKAVVQAAPSRPEVFQLLSTEGDSGEKATALLGTLESTSKKPTPETLLRLAVGGGLRQYTKRPFLLEQAEEPQGAVTRDGGPIPAGNGQFVRGL